MAPHQILIRDWLRWRAAEDSFSLCHNTFGENATGKVPACPSLMWVLFVFLTGGNTEGTISSKILCLTFVYVLLYIYVNVNFSQD